MSSESFHLFLSLGKHSRQSLSWEAIKYVTASWRKARILICFPPPGWRVHLIGPLRKENFAWSSLDPAVLLDLSRNRHVLHIQTCFHSEPWWERLGFLLLQPKLLKAFLEMQDSNSKALDKKYVWPNLNWHNPYLFVCFVLSYIKMPRRRRFCTRFGDMQIESKAAKKKKEPHQWNASFLSDSGNLHRSCASRVTSQAVFSKLLICYACYIVIVACYPRSFRQMLIQSD